MSTISVSTSKPRTSKAKALSSTAIPTPVELQASKRSAFGERVVVWAKADAEALTALATTRMGLLRDLIRSLGQKVTQEDWKSWIKAFFVAAMPDASKSNISALASVVVALSQGLEPKDGQGFDSFRVDAMAWCKEAPDTVYKVQERAPSDPAPAGDSDAPKGKRKGSATVWDRDTVLKWLSGGDSDALWAIETVLEHARDNVFLDALDKLDKEAMARAKPRARRPRA